MKQYEIGNEVGEPVNYREINDNGTSENYNYIDSLYSFTPVVYTSLENGNYIKATRTEYETAISSYKRKTSADSFNNPYFQNYFSLPNNNIGSNPIAYGVLKDNIRNIDAYNKLDASEKTLAVNQMLFTEESSNDDYKNNFDIKNRRTF